MTVPTKPRFRDSRLAKWGGTIALASAALTSYLHVREDGGAPFPPGGYVVYADKLAGGIATTCYGMTRHVTSVPPIVGERWSKERCDTEYERAITFVQESLLTCFTGTPPQNVFDGASSFAWNVGVPNVCGSQAMRVWNTGKWLAGCERMARDIDGTYVWSSVRTGRTLPSGKPEMRFVQGLANRRSLDVDFCKSS